jgi:hypothetical protein
MVEAPVVPLGRASFTGKIRLLAEYPMIVRATSRSMLTP